MPQRHPFAGRAIVVTGALGAMGSSQVVRLVAAGAQVHALDVAPLDFPAWDRVIGAEGPGVVMPYRLDVRDEDAWARFATTLDTARLAGLVNDAGVTLRSTLTQTTTQDWDRVIGINLTGTFLAIKTLAPHLEDGASIVNVSSSAGITGYFGTAYSASKWAIRGLTRSAAMELAPRGIRVNSICPGLVDSPMTRGANSVYDADRAAAFYRACEEGTLNGRGATLDEIADAVEFLLGPWSGYINAIDLPVDAGLVETSPYSRVGRAAGSLSTRQGQ
jgi:NAD(P)-dependent dehydrogenase (short-subunit alcohol dehydrogenase family)